VDASPLLWAGALLLLAASTLMLPRPVPRRSALVPVAVYGFAAWLIATNLWVSPAYSAAAPFNAAFLAGGFVLGRRAGPEEERMVFGTALAFAAGLALWALWQQVDGEGRSRALFETPATLASCLNLVLVPALVLVVMRHRRPVVIAMVSLLAVALAAAGSRGGWLALAAGLGVATALSRLGLRARVRDYGALAAALIGGVFFFSLTLGTESARERIALYEIAWQAITGSSLWLGSGYLDFHYAVEAATPAVRDYANTPIYFVHNDYLQTLLELGIPGAAGLLFLAVLPAAIAGWALRKATDGRATLIALGAGASSMAAHALVDFPFYVPVCLLMYGVMLGMLHSIASRVDEPASDPRSGHGLRRAAAAGVATLVAVSLIKPAAAEAAARRADKYWAEKRPQSAALWFEIARRVEPRDWRYHWYAGQFWFAQAQAGAGGDAAQRADTAFADGFQANPREVRNLLGRLATQRRLRGILPAPADDARLQEWALQATRLGPHDPAVRAELAALQAQSAGGAK